MALWAGEWTMIPSLSFYDHGSAPLWGRYAIAQHQDSVRFEIAWQPVSGDEMQIAFSGPLGPRHAVTDIPGITHAQYTAETDQVLISRAFDGETERAYAARRVADDGQMMAVRQRNALPDGSVSQIFQVYRRSG